MNEMTYLEAESSQTISAVEKFNTDQCQAEWPLRRGQYVAKFLNDPSFKNLGLQENK